MMFLHIGGSTMWVFIIAGFTALAGQEINSPCEIEISPLTAVVRFGDPLWANCTTLEQVQGMGWESSDGGTPLTTGVTSLSLDIKSVKNWKLTSFCYINRNDKTQCQKMFPIIVYKTPDKVSMSSHTDRLVQGQTYEINCDVVNVAPVKQLSVHWYKGKLHESPQRVHTDTYDDPSLYPGNKSSVFRGFARKDDHESLIWCEAEMKFGPKLGLLPNRSQPHKMEVLFPPTLANATDEKLELQDGNPLLLNCTSSGNPAPVYTWDFPDPIQLTVKNQTSNGPVLMPLFELPGVYKCKASNSLGNVTKVFTVIQPERDHTTLAAILGVFVVVGILLILLGLYFVTPDGTFACNKGDYQRGQPTSSGPV